MTRETGAVGAMTEAEAIRLCLAGGAEAQAAFRFIYDRHAPDVFRFQMKVLRDAGLAEDSVQETFVRLHRGLGGFDPERPLRPWVLTIARNVAIDLLRSSRARSYPLRDSAGTCAAPARSRRPPAPSPRAR